MLLSARALSKLDNEEGDRIAYELEKGLGYYIDNILSGLLSGFAWVISAREINQCDVGRGSVRIRLHLLELHLPGQTW